MKDFIILSDKEAKLINGGSMLNGASFVGVCVALFMAGWECGRAVGREIKSWL